MPLPSWGDLACALEGCVSGSSGHLEMKPSESLEQ